MPGFAVESALRFIQATLLLIQKPTQANV